MGNYMSVFFREGIFWPAPLPAFTFEERDTKFYTAEILMQAVARRPMWPVSLASGFVNNDAAITFYANLVKRYQAYCAMRWYHKGGRVQTNYTADQAYKHLYGFDLLKETTLPRLNNGNTGSKLLERRVKHVTKEQQDEEERRKMAAVDEDDDEIIVVPDSPPPAPKKVKQQRPRVTAAEISANLRRWADVQATFDNRINEAIEDEKPEEEVQRLMATRRSYLFFLPDAGEEQQAQELPIIVSVSSSDDEEEEKEDWAMRYDDQKRVPYMRIGKEVSLLCEETKLDDSDDDEVFVKALDDVEKRKQSTGRDEGVFSFEEFDDDDNDDWLLNDPGRMELMDQLTEAKLRYEDAKRQYQAAELSWRASTSTTTRRESKNNGVGNKSKLFTMATASREGATGYAERRERLKRQQMETKKWLMERAQEVVLGLEFALERKDETAGDYDPAEEVKRARLDQHVSPTDLLKQ